jgi:hypothetical protein
VPPSALVLSSPRAGAALLFLVAAADPLRSCQTSTLPFVTFQTVAKKGAKRSKNDPNEMELGGGMLVPPITIICF